MERVRETVMEVEESILFFSEKYDSILALVSNNDKKNKNFVIGRWHPAVHCG